MENLTIETVTFGKYKGSLINTVLKDRQYCKYLLEQDWFETSYPYLYSKISEYKPLDYFCKPLSEDVLTMKNFLEEYRFFSLFPLEKVLEKGLSLGEEEQTTYIWYRNYVLLLKDQIQERIFSDISNPYNVKVPTKYLQKFETDTRLDREVFKLFLSSYDLPGISSIIEDVKRIAGVECKANKGFIIAKERSEKQEKFWSFILKDYYKEYICEQFKLENCKFDFLNIRTNTIFEAKLAYKDFNEKQYLKYKLILNRFKIVYLIGETTLVDIDKKVIYTTDYGGTIEHQVNIPLNSKSTYFDELIFDFEIEPVSDLKEALDKL